MNLFEKYQAQKEKGKELVSRYREAIRETERKIAELKAQYADTLHEEIETGKSKDTQLKKIQGEIDAAEQKLATLREQHTTARFRSQQVTPEDVINWWNGERLPEIKAEKIEPALKALIEAQRAYAEAAEQYFRAVQDAENERHEIRIVLGDRYQYRLNSAELQRKDEREKYFITDFEAREVRNGIRGALRLKQKHGRNA